MLEDGHLEVLLKDCNLVQELVFQSFVLLLPILPSFLLTWRPPRFERRVAIFGVAIFLICLHYDAFPAAGRVVIWDFVLLSTRVALQLFLLCGFDFDLTLAVGSSGRRRQRVLLKDKLMAIGRSFNLDRLVLLSARIRKHTVEYIVFRGLNLSFDHDVRETLVELEALSS